MAPRKLRQGLWLSESTRTWHFEIKVQGEKKKGDTGCAQLALAREWLKAYRQQLALGRVGLAQFPAKPPLTLRKAHESWEAFAAGRLSPSWRATVGRSLRLHFAPFMDRPLTALTSEEVQAMVTAYLQEDGHSKGGSNVLLRALNSVVSHAIALDPSFQRPYRVKLAKVQEKPRAPLDAKRLGALVATLEALAAPAQVLAMARLMAGLGLRVGEARRARVEAVNLKAKTFTPWDPEAGTKGKEAVE
ncbi:MAG TPA: hypothetical protein VJ623_11875, partial [Holophagaceae bacterium]|nr:hypothetical protein [Holophagaceae bacterium]